MRRHIKIGLIVGAVGLVVNIGVTFLIEICGPVTSTIAGIVAGFLSVRITNLPTRSQGAQIGSVSGAIAGVLVLVGQILGSAISLFLAQLLELALPSTTTNTPQLAGNFSSISTSLCVGLIGISFSILVGAGAGYFGTTEKELTPET